MSRATAAQPLELCFICLSISHEGGAPAHWTKLIQLIGGLQWRAADHLPAFQPNRLISA